jgi:hypothetical protein
LAGLLQPRSSAKRARTRLQLGSAELLGLAQKRRLSVQPASSSRKTLLGQMDLSSGRRPVLPALAAEMKEPTKKETPKMTLRPSA